MLKAYVTCAPENGQANRQLIELLASACGVPKSRVELRMGSTSRTKIIFVPGCTVEQADAAILSACSG